MTNVLYMPDGNRRFSLARGVSLPDAYILGGKTLKLLSQFFLVEERAKMLVYHALSEYTHKRTDLSVSPIFDAAEKTFEDLARESFFQKNGIKFRAVDHSEKLPASLERTAKLLSDSTSDSEGKECVVLLGYSLERDFDLALSKSPADYNSLRKNFLFPDMNLVIRPLEMRPSNGPVYAMGQAQMIVLNKMNSEVAREDLETTWQTYLSLRENKIKGNPIHQR